MVALTTNNLILIPWWYKRYPRQASGENCVDRVNKTTLYSFSIFIVSSTWHLYNHTTQYISKKASEHAGGGGAFS